MKQEIIKIAQFPEFEIMKCNNVGHTRGENYKDESAQSLSSEGKMIKST